MMTRGDRFKSQVGVVGMHKRERDDLSRTGKDHSIENCRISRSEQDQPPTPYPTFQWTGRQSTTHPKTREKEPHPVEKATRQTDRRLHPIGTKKSKIFWRGRSYSLVQIPSRTFIRYSCPPKPGARNKKQEAKTKEKSRGKKTERTSHRASRSDSIPYDIYDARYGKSFGHDE